MHPLQSSHRIFVQPNGMGVAQVYLSPKLRPIGTVWPQSKGDADAQENPRLNLLAEGTRALAQDYTKAMR